MEVSLRLCSNSENSIDLDAPENVSNRFQLAKILHRSAI